MDDLGFLEFNTLKDLYVKLKHDYMVLKEEPNCSNTFHEKSTCQGLNPHMDFLFF